MLIKKNDKMRAVPVARGREREIIATRRKSLIIEGIRKWLVHTEESSHKEPAFPSKVLKTQERRQGSL